jgi:hypothetical protein
MPRQRSPARVVGAALLFVPSASWDVRERGTSGHLIGPDGAYVITIARPGR